MKAAITLSVDVETKERWQRIAKDGKESLTKFITSCVEGTIEEVGLERKAYLPVPQITPLTESGQAAWQSKHTDVDTLSGMAGVVPAAPQIEPSRVVSKVKNAKKPAKVRDRGPALCPHRRPFDQFCGYCVEDR